MVSDYKRILKHTLLNDEMQNLHEECGCTEKILYKIIFFDN